MDHRVQQPRNPWRTVASTIAYESQWMRVRHDTVIRPDGRSGTYDVLERPRSNQIIALNGQREIFLVGQYRYPTGTYSWELPGGACEEGEDPLETAKRELREETGLVSSVWTCITSLELLNGTTPALVDLYTAEDVQQIGTDKAAEDGIEQLIAQPVSKVLQMIRDREIRNSPTLACMFSYCLHLGQAALVNFLNFPPNS